MLPGILAPLAVNRWNARPTVNSFCAHFCSVYAPKSSNSQKPPKSIQTMTALVGIGLHYITPTATVGLHLCGVTLLGETSEGLSPGVCVQGRFSRGAEGPAFVLARSRTYSAQRLQSSASFFTVNACRGASDVRLD